MKKIDYKKIKFFGETIYKFCGYFKVKKPLTVKPDRRIKTYTASVSTLVHKVTGKNDYIIRYSPESISELDFWQLAYVVLHELGHIKTRITKDEFATEYRAEKFAHDMIKKHFGFLYPKYRKYISWYIQASKSDVYTEVFTTLKKKLERQERRKDYVTT